MTRGGSVDALELSIEDLLRCEEEVGDDEGERTAVMVVIVEGR